MKKSKFNHTDDEPRYNKTDRKRQDAYDYEEEEEYIPRKRRDAGKRFHRKKTLKDQFWDNLTDTDS